MSVPFTAAAPGVGACAACLRRGWLVGAMAGHLEIAWRGRRATRDVLALGDLELIDALGGATAPGLRAAHAAFDPGELLAACVRAEVVPVCLHAAAYPERLRVGADAPAVLFCAGDATGLEGLAGPVEDPAHPVVSIVGARRASADGLEVARALGRGLAAAGVVVVSGMALGIDAAAHEGALAAGGATVAVLACGPERAYPPRKAPLHRALRQRGLVVSELPPGAGPRRWAFPARNRIIAALGRVTIVVEAAERSGSLITADFAAAFGRDVAAVPGRAWSSRARGSNGLLRDGAAALLDVEGALDLVLGVDGRRAAPAVPAAPLEAGAAWVLEAVGAGEDPFAGRLGVAAVLGHLTELELAGRLRRVGPGAYVATGPPPPRTAPEPELLEDDRAARG